MTSCSQMLGKCPLQYIMVDVFVTKDGTKEDVEESLKAAIEKVEGA
jgi:hypothetical protein